MGSSPARRSGIGKAVVAAPAWRGRRGAGGRHRRRRLAELAGAGCETLAGDVADRGAAARSRNAADGGDYLVNSAGIILIKPIFEVTSRTGAGSRRSTPKSIFFLCQKIGPRLQPGGAIVNLSSSSAKLATTIEVAAYAASKTTILSITRSFAYALAAAAGAGQRDLPGIVDTPMQEAVLRECRARCAA